MAGESGNARNTAPGWLRQRRHPGFRPLAFAVALGELSGILLILQTALLVQVGNAVIFGGAGLPQLMPYFAALPPVILARFAALWGSRRLAAECASRAKASIRADLVSCMRNLGPVTMTGMRSGEVVSTTVDAVEALDGYYARYLPQRALSTIIPFTILAVVFPLDWTSGLVLVLTAVFLPVSMIVIGDESHARNQRLWAALTRMSGRFLDILRGLPTVRMFGAARREAEEIARASDEHRTMTMSVLRVAFLTSFMLELLSALSIAIVAILSGFRLLAGAMPFAPAYFILLIAPEYFLALRTLGTFYHARMEAMGASEHIITFLKTPARQGRALLSPGPAAVQSVGPAPPGPSCAVEFESVSFAYDRRAVLSGASFSLRPGERVALTGPSGAGKSTIVSLLLGFVAADQGSVRIDGSPIALVGRRAWLDRISWLPQNPTLFHGTIRENIGLGRTGASDLEIQEAARLACVDEFSCRFPAGLDTPLGEGGQGLSMGQVQRVALARLFLRSPGLVLLDEPTAHLDEKSAELVRAGIEILTRGRTVLVVTHHGAESVDRTLVLENGRVSEKA
ncbi:MAG TPA: thiol reductant ABC exporter subunit CydD [Spirochaetia bacterium]|nr:thiol reductant ABC exporter subunit CydD [Spirochaetia bacterium]